MVSALYRCPPNFNCRCSAGALVSRTTVSRHRDIAQSRLRVAENDPTITLSIPPPISTCEEQEDYNDTANEDRGIRAFEDTDVFSYPPQNAYDGNEDVNTRSDLSCEDRQEFAGHDVTSRDISMNSPGLEEDVVSLYSSMRDSDNISADFSSQGVPSEGLGTLSLPSEGPEFSNSPPYELGYSNDYINGEDESEMERFLHTYGWHCGYYLRHNVTLQAMNDILQHDFPYGTKTWSTVRSQVEALSGLRKHIHHHCNKSHELLRYDEESGRISPCSHSPCDSTGTEYREIYYIFLWERIQALLLSTVDGPIMTGYVRNGYHRYQMNNLMTDFYCGTGFANFVKRKGIFADNDTAMGYDVLHVFLSVSTDGAPAFKSATKSVWPVYVFIGNLPPQKRYKEKYILPVMCIPGNPKDLESFLRPLYDEIEMLGNGRACKIWDGSERLIRVHLMMEMSDIQA